jgi:hypothetical protein
MGKEVYITRGDNDVGGGSAAQLVMARWEL